MKEHVKEAPTCLVHERSVLKNYDENKFIMILGYKANHKEVDKVEKIILYFLRIRLNLKEPSAIINR
jgi:hypothetical protein